MIKHRNKPVLADKECKKTDKTNSVQSSLKSHPLWVTLYVSWILSNRESCLNQYSFKCRLELLLIYAILKFCRFTVERISPG